MKSQARADSHSRELRTLLLATVPPTCTFESLSDLALDVNTVCTVLGRLEDRACFRAREQMTI